MKKIDVQNQITKYLSSNHFTIIDSLTKPYTIQSYDQYIECFNLIKNTYQNNIIEYCEEAKKYINLMNNFITKAIENSDTDSIEQYIVNNIKDSLVFGYNRNVNLISIYPKSFLLQRECSQEAFTNIYSEL